MKPVMRSDRRWVVRAALDLVILFIGGGLCMVYRLNIDRAETFKTGQPIAEDYWSGEWQPGAAVQ